jgi:hypothetical protein
MEFAGVELEGDRVVCWLEFRHLGVTCLCVRVRVCIAGDRVCVCVCVCVLQGSVS